MAEKNGLSIGDSISLSADGTSEVKIIGFFEVKKQVQAFTSVTSFDKLENQIFTTQEVYQELIPDLVVGFDRAVFQVNDPAQLEEIVSQVEQNTEIDWQAFKIETNNQTYQDAAEPLMKFQTLITTVLILIVIVSAVVLSLILTMWARSRVHETGVLLSIGIKKPAIISQYLAEVLMLAVFAFGLSFFTSNLIADQLGNSLLRTQVQSAETQTKDENQNGLDIAIKDQEINNDIVLNNKEDGGEPIQKETTVEPLKVSIGFDNMAELYLIGFIIIVLSVGISSGGIMHLKPREILSKMS